MSYERGRSQPELGGGLTADEIAAMHTHRMPQGISSMDTPAAYESPAIVPPIIEPDITSAETTGNTYETEAPITDKSSPAFITRREFIDLAEKTTGMSRTGAGMVFSRLWNTSENGSQLMSPSRERLFMQCSEETGWEQVTTVEALEQVSELHFTSDKLRLAAKAVAAQLRAEQDEQENGDNTKS